jgi:hypothetical protein
MDAMWMVAMIGLGIAFFALSVKAVFYQLRPQAHGSILGDNFKAWYKASQSKFSGIPV